MQLSRSHEGSGIDRGQVAQLLSGFINSNDYALFFMQDLSGLQLLHQHITQSSGLLNENVSPVTRQLRSHPPVAAFSGYFGNIDTDDTSEDAQVYN